METKSVYLISNGSSMYYPQNTLTKFTNKLPIPIDLSQNERWEVGVESIGVSCLYRNIQLPLNPSTPSFFITNCNLKKRFIVCDDDPNKACGEGPVSFKFRTNEDDQDCFWWSFRFEDRIYTQYDLHKLSERVKEETKLELEVGDGKLSFQLSRDSMRQYEYLWVLIHQSMKNTFNINGNVLYSQVHDGNDPYSEVRVVEIDGKYHTERIANYKGEKYYAYLISNKGVSKEVTSSSNTFISSNDFSLDDRNYPKFIKVVCDSIQPQILNSSYSKDLLIFSPDFKNTENYYFRELDCVDYVPLLNNYISDLTIRLLDENNEQLQLLYGYATIIKLKFRRMPQEKRSFNVRLTSSASKEFPENQLYHFKVKLPSSIQLDQTWKVCVNSISHPSHFSTFLPELNSRQILFKSFIDLAAPVIKYFFSDKITYSQENLISEFNYFLSTNDLGHTDVDVHGKLHITISGKGTFILTAPLARMLGYDGELKDGKAAVIKTHGTTGFPQDSEGNCVVTFNNPIDINYLKPNYMIIYSNIAKSSVFGGGYNKIIRVVPLKESKLNYIIKEFKHKELYELENNEINIIEIQLRSHDGSYVNFAHSQDIILNLEFSNYSELY